MCGIVAVFGDNSRSFAKKALKKLKHRGLDNTKLITYENFSFGFNRLAINDKSSKGKQPFEFGKFIGVFNGEIYNYQELKDEFKISTNSNCDTEIILPLFEKLGSSIVKHLNGFYSGIIFNKGTGQTYVLRDYIGKKPLFYGTRGGSEFIVSELKAIEHIDSFEIIPKGFSAINNRKINLLCGHTIQRAAKKNLKNLVLSAVEKRIPKSESQFGVFLSGGLDSSIIASIVAKHTDKAIYYTLGNENANDLHYVKILTKMLGIEDKLRVVSLPLANEIPTLIDKVVYHTESYNPSIISNGLSTFLLSKKAHEDGIKVVLSGEGADELFCGYKFSNNATGWFDKRDELIENMHFTELRRLDLASMAHTIEIRCPFLDKEVYATSKDCFKDDLILETDNGLRGKQILRTIFENDLPNEIIERKKISFDVGSGIRKLVVEYLTRNEESERDKLKKVWCKHFQSSISNNEYFYSYPTFDKAIDKRGFLHK